MASRIVCYRLEANPGPRELSLPASAEPLAATYHNGAVGVWVRLLEKAKAVPDPAGATAEADAEVFEPRTFELIETGKVLSGRYRYLGTCAAPGGTFCMHVLERLEPDAVERHPGRSLAQRIEGLEDEFEEIAANLRCRIEGLESPAGESIEDVIARIETLDSLRVSLEDELETVRDRVDALERGAS